MRLALCTAAAVVLVSSAQAQWTYRELTAPGATSTFVSSLGAPSMAGRAVGGTWSRGGDSLPMIWVGEAATPVDLTPRSGAAGAFVRGTDGVHQVGEWLSSVDRILRPAMWAGTRESFVDLTPAGYRNGTAHAAAGNVQVGEASVTGTTALAMLWHGTAASAVNMTPTDALGGAILGTDGQQHVGYVYRGGVMRPTLWTAESRAGLDLTPAGQTTGWATATARGVQVGQVRQRAGLWRGTAASWVQLHPAGADTSEARGVAWRGGTASVQVGWARYPNGARKALLWEGTAASMVDLGSVLAANLVDPTAEGVYWEGGRLIVAGWAYRQVGGSFVTVALEWSRVTGEPCTAEFNGDGFVDFFDYEAFVACFESGACEPGRTADVNGDGMVDQFDYLEFVTAFEAGC